VIDAADRARTAMSDMQPTPMFVRGALSLNQILATQQRRAAQRADRAGTLQETPAI
jgi:hypothetical protein